MRWVVRGKDAAERPYREVWTFPRTQHRAGQRGRAAQGFVLNRALNVEADVQDIAVADDVRLALERLHPAACSLGVRARVDEVAPADHLAADEPARDVGVDRPGGVERGLPVAERPGARLLLARGEERDQVERVAEPADDLLERRGAAV